MDHLEPRLSARRLDLFVGGTVPRAAARPRSPPHDIGLDGARQVSFAAADVVRLHERRSAFIRGQEKGTANER